jgi:hypothetical protein
VKSTSAPILIVAVTEHNTRIWDLLADSHALPTIVDCPPGSSRSDHVIADRHHRGRGQGNMAQGFLKFLDQRKAQRGLHVHSLVNANIPAMTDAQIVAKARAILEPLTA